MSWSEVGSRWRVKLSEVDWYLCFGLMFFTLVVFGLSMAVWKLNIMLNDADALPIEAVAIKGERKYTSDEEIQVALQDLMKRSFFSADVNQVQEALEALPWVYQASVRREWPAKLKVFLIEQNAVAHWNGDAWLNSYGEVFDAPTNDDIGPLPKLAGPEGQSKVVLTTYGQVSELLEINGFNLNSLSLSPRHAWHGVLDNGILLELGREDKMARIQRFINVFPTLEKQVKTVAKVDLRYDTGLAVGWVNAQKRASK
ncbi:cell division protein FtsQ/DivIB [Shewanella eurypsychrophilus]|uniref:Cell division protein FtsQ n=1 Tax=Shewanella eurypsychrophilus TaxID=2593656 RepID=A0ABX6V2U7_9GAMM|nr:MULTISPECIES: cell division protein FtsQ/DivIB [Shewanella]QFU20733.1 FtsQ-type POTRA domain-containing protein [Shewanella sp. YLB-09]QFU21011.1 FtsQ-type POTRA domain-containing protein [Shewanella sp. YLB-09]QPG56300.1 cell division protein FtsQ/DivIB [Shewanella eurypsychrophilus]